MIILSRKKINDDELEYSFSIPEYKNTVFNILVKFDVKEEGGDAYLTADFNQLTHTVNDEEVIIENSDVICANAVQLLLESLLETLTKLAEESCL